MSAITIQDVSKSYGPVSVLKGLDLDIRDGEFVSFLGPSGCGKSTLLFCIAGLEEITAGHVLFDGRDVGNLSARDRNIALVFQDYALYPHMSVRENLAFPLRQQKVTDDLIGKQVAWSAGLLGLEALLDRQPAELSGGQRQRVAVGRAIVRNPAALLMDEPLSNLDAALRVKTRTEIKRLQRELKNTVVFVTHDQEEAMVLSDRIAVMNGGVLQQFAPPMVIYKEPANLFVAGFIGSPQMNVLPGETAPGGHGAARVVGVRPHDLVPATRTAPADDDFRLQGELVLIEPAGPLHYLDVQVGDQIVKATCPDPDGLAVGERLTLAAPGHTVHLFDRDSGTRLSEAARPAPRQAETISA
jgi:ABC-type sugar transport system ATPase subunit